MAITEVQRHSLFDALQKLGWHPRDGFLYAPHETMWLLISDPWSGDLQDFHERMVGRMQRCAGLRWIQKSDSEHQVIVDDVTGLVRVLDEMISNESHAASYDGS